MMSNNMIGIYEKKIKSLKICLNEKWAIYGTGKGAELIFNALRRLHLNDTIKYVIEKDEKIDLFREFRGIPVKKLSQVYDKIDGIIIAAFYNHQIIKERIHNSLTEEQLSNIRIIDIFTYNTDEDKLEYVDYIEKSILKSRIEFIDFDEQEYQIQGSNTKIIAWYLPQFHQMEINNKFHGQGFTEWTNTSRTIPMFIGHYQPHIPYDVGYYDLLNLETLKRQIFLAKHYGVYGFCIHYYWFSGKRFMEKPLQLLLEHKELDIPFCLDWATENWSTLWDGGNEKVMVEQKLLEDDDQKFMEDILPYMEDTRYIKIEGRPILVIYRVNLFEKNRVRKLLYNFRKIAKQRGFPDLYIMLTNALDFNDDVEEWGADALVEYQPHAMLPLMEQFRPAGYLNPYFNGCIFDAQLFIENKKYMIEHVSRRYYRSALVSWDNTARKAVSRGNIVQGLNPDTLKKWLSDIITESKEIHSMDENIVFVNSWNEWAEGSHLEPDMKYGYGYLQAIKDVLEELDNRKD